MNKPYHENVRLANSHSYWAPFDTQQRWEYNMKDRPTRNLLTKLGYDNPEAISYKYNSDGFRDIEFDSRPCGLALGCSFTHGTGIEENGTWPRALSKLLGYHVWNLGIGGASLDTVFRISEYYIQKLRPKFVAVLIPPDTRFEYFTGERYQIATIHDNSNDDFFKHWFLNTQNTDIHRQKNLLALENLSENFNSKFVTICPINHWPDKKNSRARDLVHPDAESNTKVARQFFNLLNLP